MRVTAIFATSITIDIIAVLNRYSTLWQESEGKMIDKGYGIMPNTILFDDKLSSSAKLVFVFVSSLSAEQGFCWASNTYIAKRFNMGKSTISALISELVDAGYLTIEIEENYKRKLKLGVLENEIPPPENSVPPTSKLSTPPPEISVHNNTSNNNINNKYKLIKEKAPQAVELAEVLAKKVKDNYDFLNPTEKDIANWANDIRLINEQDKYDYKIIEAVIDWALADSFWRQNIRSGSKLRKQFNTLLVQIKDRPQNVRVIS